MRTLAIGRKAAVPALVVLLAIGLVGCRGPFLLLPGETLEGTTVAAPDSWSFTDAIDTVQLETRPSDPYSVNIWVIAIDPHLYVHAGTNRSTWVESMEADPKVRLGVEGSIYELAAERVEDQAEFDRFADAYETKYGRRPGNEDVGEAHLFRLRTR